MVNNPLTIEKTWRSGLSVDELKRIFGYLGCGRCCGLCEGNCTMRHYSLTPTESTCPICYSSNAHILWSASSEQSAQHFKLKEVDRQRFLELASHIESLWRQHTCEVVCCDNCGFCYSNPYIAGDERFYTLASGGSGYPAWKWEYQLTYEVLEKSSDGFNLLEIGAGDGAFVRRIAPALTPKQNVVCTEFSDYGRNQIRTYGIACFSEDIRVCDSPELNEYFDVVCMFQVLEHTDHLDSLFQRLNWLTRRKANLFIAVPNPKWIKFKRNINLH